MAVEYKSDVSVKDLHYSDFSSERVVQGDMELKFENDMFITDLTIDYLYSSRYKDRRYLSLNEFYFTKEYEDYSLSIGKTIKYWGELEGFNIADVYNQKNYLLDPFGKSQKIGSLGLNILRYFDDDTLEFGVKFYEEDLEYSSSAPYYPLSLDYDSELKLSKERYTPTIYMIYGFNTDESLDSESKIILFHGYDNKRYFTPKNLTTLFQYAYRVNKFIFLSHVVFKEMIFKCESSYTDVISDKSLSDYAQVSLGLEKSFYNFKNIDTTLYLEYYRYIYMQENKIESVDISEIYSDDMFVALKMNFNDVGSSEVKSGVLYDFSNKEKVFKVEAKSRVLDSFILSADFMRIFSAPKTILTQFGDSTRTVVSLTYSF